ncbi:MAG: hypothetical protein M3Z57_05235 [Candidatus Dormibacteraeota bacterium]|nr:hypothetical protein [Candidatus Dormibacteraeota bacterium]
MSENHPGNQEVEKSGGAPVEEGPETTPEQALEGNEDSTEQRSDTDQAGHEPGEHGTA